MALPSVKGPTRQQALYDDRATATHPRGMVEHPYTALGRKTPRPKPGRSVTDPAATTIKPGRILPERQP
jgi:hypothetical protein